MTEAEFGELFNNAYSTVASIDKAQSGFRKTGIYPYNRDVFSDEDFLAAMATDQPIDGESGQLATVSFSQLANESVQPMPRPAKKRRRVQHAAIITSSPYKKLIEEQSKNEGKKKKNDTGIKNRPTSAKRAISTERGKRNRKVRKQQKKKQISGSGMVEAADGDDRDAQCLYCGEFWSVSARGDDWIQCQACCKWAHVACSGVNKKAKQFICDMCI